MPPRRSLALVQLLLLSGVATSTATTARADGEAAHASASCEPSAGPGRVRCEAEIIAPTGATVRWADVQIVETPAFVSALKGRIGPADTTLRERDKWRFSFGLVARGRGTGDVKLRVRVVVCREQACSAELVPVTVAIASGP